MFCLSIYFEICRIFQTLLVIANNIHRHIEVLLFSTSFVISVMFGDGKMEKIGSICVTGIENIAKLLSLKSSPFFLPKGGRSSAFIS